MAKEKMITMTLSQKEWEMVSMGLMAVDVAEIKFPNDLVLNAIGFIHKDEEYGPTEEARKFAGQLFIKIAKEALGVKVNG